MRRGWVVIHVAGLENCWTAAVLTRSAARLLLTHVVYMADGRCMQHLTYASIHFEQKFSAAFNKNSVIKVHTGNYDFRSSTAQFGQIDVVSHRLLEDLSSNLARLVFSQDVTKNPSSLPILDGRC
jgi:hypothetical protein